VNGVKVMYGAKDIALWFVYKTNAEIKENQIENDDYDVYEGISHLKLQKLVYYAQGVCLSILGRNLFEEPIIAWEHGPVVNVVYDEYRKNGRNYITLSSTAETDAIITRIEQDGEISRILNVVYDNFAIYTAWQLREMTHEINSPWYVTKRDKGLNSVIENDIIKKYFDEVVMES
jgi:uncharacterized phage-associated protein